MKTLILLDCFTNPFLLGICKQTDFWRGANQPLKILPAPILTS